MAPERCARCGHDAAAHATLSGHCRDVSQEWGRCHCTGWQEPPSDTGGSEPRTPGAGLIAAERQRQITEEGYTAEHDHGHADELLAAARCYAAAAASVLHGERPALIAPPLWPWHQSYWKPTGDPHRDLVKAGALIAAAIDARRDRYE